MFNKENFKKIGEDVYVMHKFIRPHELHQINQYLDGLNEEDWWQPHPELRFKVKEDKGVKKLKEIRSKVSSLLDNGYYFGTNIHPFKLMKGTSRNPHSDKHEFLEALEANKLYVEGEEFEYADAIDLGVYVFLNDFEGGEFYYNKQDILYKPKAGDLIFHSPEDHCSHATKEVLSDKYYAWANHVYHSVKIPKGYVAKGHKLTDSGKR
jgi:hypothetical protein